MSLVFLSSSISSFLLLAPGLVPTPTGWLLRFRGTAMSSFRFHLNPRILSLKLFLLFFLETLLRGRFSFFFNSRRPTTWLWFQLCSFCPPQRGSLVSPGAPGPSSRALWPRWHWRRRRQGRLTSTSPCRRGSVASCNISAALVQVGESSHQPGAWDYGLLSDSPHARLCPALWKETLREVQATTTNAPRVTLGRKTWPTLITLRWHEPTDEPKGRK